MIIRVSFRALSVAASFTSCSNIATLGPIEMSYQELMYKRRRAVVVLVAAELGVLPLGIVREAIDEVVEVVRRSAEHVHDLIDRQRAHRGVDLQRVDRDLGHHVPLLMDRGSCRRACTSTGRRAERDCPMPCCRTSRPSRPGGPRRRGRSCPSRCMVRPGRSLRRSPLARPPRIPGYCAALSRCCSSALDEHPIAPTFPLDQGCDVIHLIVSKPSSAVRTRNVYVPRRRTGRARIPRRRRSRAGESWRRTVRRSRPKWCASIR